MIIIEPKGGLCNRLRFIDSARTLCRTIGRPLTILWRHDSELACDYPALFDSCDDISVIQTGQVPFPKGRFSMAIHYLRNYLRYKCRYGHVIFESRLNRLLKAGYDFTLLKQYPETYLTGCSRFFRPQRRFLPLPVGSSIQQQVERITSRYSADAVGVHIRRTDHQQATQNSPESAFICAMQEQLRQQPQTIFFLASDSPETENRFRTEFGDRILTHTKEVSRHTERGVQDALIDLLCLSKTTKIIGSAGSSFSETAAQLNDIPLETVTAAVQNERRL